MSSFKRACLFIISALFSCLMELSNIMWVPCINWALRGWWGWGLTSGGAAYVGRGHETIRIMSIHQKGKALTVIYSLRLQHLAPIPQSQKVNSLPSVSKPVVWTSLMDWTDYSADSMLWGLQRLTARLSKFSLLAGAFELEVFECYDALADHFGSRWVRKGRWKLDGEARIFRFFHSKKSQANTRTRSCSIQISLVEHIPKWS